MSGSYNPDPNSWSLRHEILRLAHQWPHILLVCLAGCILAWLVSWLWPTRYQAAIELYVGLGSWDIVATLTPEQAAAADTNHPVEIKTPQSVGQDFKNFIDYKNWQMNNLNGLVFMDQTLKRTLRQLQAQDGYWSQVTPAQLAAILSAHWRSAGKWRLAAVHEQPLRASQAVFAWQNAILEETHTAIEAARQQRQLTPLIQENAAAQTQLQQKLAALTQARQAVDEQLTQLSRLPQSQPLAELDRWLIWQTIMQAELAPTWLPLIDAFPAPSQAASNYSAWLQKAAQAIAAEIQLVQEQISSLEAQNQELYDRYTHMQQASLGLSANLDIQAIQNKTPQELELCAALSTARAQPQCDFLTALRPTGTLMLIGAGLGLLIWLMNSAIRLAIRAQSQAMRAQSQAMRESK